MDVIVQPLAVDDLGGEVEVVEHKGLGHPDTMCDALAEAFGVALARFYRERFGSILHFNVDKALLSGGASRTAFGGGEVVAPMQVLLAGRATRQVRGVLVPVDDIAVETSKAWVRDNMHALDPDRHVVWNCLVRGGSADLVDLFKARGPERATHHLANDTSLAAGYAPLSTLERVVLAAADRLRDLARARREVGEDVKVMGVRRRDRLHLTVACAFIGGHLASLADYVERRGDVAREVREAAEQAAGREVTVEVNTADDVPAGRVYLTVTGTSAEAGDDGEVGRGNRVNGLITPYRPMSLEAAAGKNPVSHVGKLYNVAAHRIAAAVVERVDGVTAAQCFMLSCIGRRVDDPVVVDVHVRMREGAPVDTVRGRISDVVRDAVAAVGELADELLEGRIRLF